MRANLISNLELLSLARECAVKRMQLPETDLVNGYMIYNKYYKKVPKSQRALFAQQYTNVVNQIRRRSA
jgi:hypothetical protein